MSQATYQAPFIALHGAIGKNGLVTRQKKYRIHGTPPVVGKNEMYPVNNPRDRIRMPPQGEELRNINLFRQAAMMTATELRDPEKYAYWHQRFLEQIDKPEPDNKRTYIHFPSFVRTMLMKQLRKKAETTH